MSEAEVELDLEVKADDMRSRTTYILLFFRHGFPGSEQRGEEEERGGREALRIFLFGSEGGHIRRLSREGKLPEEEGEFFVLSSAFAFCFVCPRWTQNGSTIPQPGNAGFCCCCFLLFF